MIFDILRWEITVTVPLLGIQNSVLQSYLVLKSFWQIAHQVKRIWRDSLRCSILEVPKLLAAKLIRDQRAEFRANWRHHRTRCPEGLGSGTTCYLWRWSRKPKKSSFTSFLGFETGPTVATAASLQLTVRLRMTLRCWSLSLQPEYWDYGCLPPCLVYIVLGLEPWAVHYKPVFNRSLVKDTWRKTAPSFHKLPHPLTDAKLCP